MKWKATPDKPQPKIGDKREVKKFSLFPVKVGDKWIWLEDYIATQQYSIFYYTYDEVISEGIIYEKYITRVGEGERWETIEKKLFIKPVDETEVQNLY